MQQQEKPGLGKALLINCAIVVVISLYLFLLYTLGIKDSWITFLFLWYYASVKEAAAAECLPSACGALFGFALSGLLSALPALLGQGVGLGLFFALIFVVVLLQVMGRLSLLINGATFLFLTVGCIPLIAGANAFAVHFAALATGVVFWSLFIHVARTLLTKKAHKPATACEHSQQR
ncbi:hypothetical protein [Craterilacuibacter sp. RT1T]|uniref:hypothetical protein n=1 Tax=Craterilacuibacter sp. RT1T TaxID=2942211 RepID=UPI0020C044BA|nr:hypothetical protein [Craterilacuibacter sp. RT1T]MCL6262995.1 hypothetical protein [Craterilacuibacter sp. RT1T]